MTMHVFLSLFLFLNTYISVYAAATPQTYTVSLHNDTPLSFNLVYSELGGTTFLQTPGTLAPNSDLLLTLTSSEAPSAIIRFYQESRPSFSLVLIGTNAYTSYCKDKPSAYQQGMYCKLDTHDFSVDLSILADSAPLS